MNKLNVPVSENIHTRQEGAGPDRTVEKSFVNEPPLLKSEQRGAAELGLEWLSTLNQFQRSRNLISGSRREET